jgi:hypothetical protein
MATYDELLIIATSTGGALLSKIKVAVVVSCDTIRAEAVGATNHANRLKWAQETLRDPDAMARRMLWAVLAQNKAATPSAITTASDATVQTAVDAAVDLLAQG